MSKLKHYIVTVTEWGPDHEPMDFHKVEKLRKNGWDLPTVEDFENAATAELKGFTDPDDTYWASHGVGDAAALVPNIPSDRTICNQYDVQHRLRLIRRMPSKTITSDPKSKISKVALIGK
ncbi:MAG: hypothetical protein KBC33_04110 [Candidatus Pacebacteria bacterium]|nr:hypothetical protein [Candidatus Paceibacterota bacterium]